MKKFNAFSGVFTPSVLTILGVIMYMRLGWVVGEAGIIYALIIIIVAHIISFSTGLSISSIATDKKIKTGGIYYILSRSLGLPMGGAIGIALTVGMAFSIALYVIGFLESILSVEAIDTFVQNIGLDPTSKNTFRIFGTVVLLLLTILAFISTSLAIKTQFIVMGAIFLSLISIVVGLILNGNFSFSEAIWTKADSDVSIEYIFSIFFPAVTGFTAGVSMSGDLRDPKKDIPKGTMLAIIVGFVVYIGLALVLGLSLKREVLINDMNFLLPVSWVAMLVLAGVWGATLSSALGGILGGPRITQAISGDKILPKFLSKGYGEGNEPRIALIATFFIAEAGILIGELNAIAGIVSMFFLASYGFINLAFWLESIASTDFRPTFKVPKIVGLIGFIFSFVVMFKLDVLAMFISLAIMFVIFIILKRRELKLDFGDVWQSVGTSLVRNILTRINKKTLEQRNWRPNIILFSGGTNKRGYLLELGKSIVGKYGFLSNFDIIESKNSEKLLPKHKQNIIDAQEDSKGIFTRRKTCDNIYEGIESISSTYGFSGVEPDTVMMGWARESSKPIRFAKMIKKLNVLDLNIILIDYDQRFGYGKYQLIDIWWRGAGNNGNFALSLIKFLWSSHEWRDAKLRIMIVNPVNNEMDNIHNNVSEILDNLRVEAEIRIINNEMEKKSFYEIIKVESINTDLTFIGIPPVIDNKEADFVSKTNDLMHEIGTVILIKASSLFKNLHIGSNPNLYKKKTDEQELLLDTKIEAKKIELPTNILISKHLDTLIENFNSLNDEYIHNYLLEFVTLNNSLLVNIEMTATKHFAKIEKALNHTNTDIIIAAEKSLSNILIRTRREINKFKEKQIVLQKKILQEANSKYQTQIKEFVNQSENKFVKSISLKDVEIEKNSNLITRLTKTYRKIIIKISGHPISYKIKYKQLLKSYFPYQSQIVLKNELEHFGKLNIAIIFELHNLQRMLKERLILIKQKAQNNELTEELFYEKQQDIFVQIENIEQINKNAVNSIHSKLNENTTKIIEKINDDVHFINPNSLIIKRKPRTKQQKKLTTYLEQAPSRWLSNKELLLNGLIIENQLLIYENRLRKIIYETISNIKIIINNTVLHDISYLINCFDNINSEQQKNKEIKFEPKINSEHFSKEFYLQKINSILETAFKNLKLSLRTFPQKMNLLNNESYNNISKHQFEKVNIIDISVSRLIDYIIQEELMSPLQIIIEQLPANIIELHSEIQNVLRIINNTIFDENNKIIKKNYAKNIELFKDKKLDLEELKKGVSKLVEQFNIQISERLNGTVDKLNYQSFIKSASKFNRYVIKIENKKRVYAIKKGITNIKLLANKHASMIWYKQSEAVIMKENLSNESKEHKKVNNLLDFIELVSIEPDIKEKLPFYYQQLFLRKNFTNDFWFARKKELKTAQQTINRYNSGFNGALLILGEQFAGKTFLSNYISDKYLHAQPTYTINPPFAGSVKINDLKKTINEVTGLRGTIEQVFDRLPEKTVIILDNLELWWEKSENGMQVIKQINSHIEKYSSKILFIINCNVHSFLLINKLYKITPSFLNIIECEPFTAEQLKDIVLFRHNSSNLKLILGTKKENRIKLTDYARFFNKLFQYTKGNIGIALQTWLANITEYKDRTIKINRIKVPDTSSLDILQKEILIIIIQFFLHKRLTIDKAQRVTLIDMDELLKKINYLKRSGIIVENMPKIYEINPFVYIHLKNKLQEENMLA